MKLDWLKNLASNALQLGKEKAPTLLTTLGIGLGATTVVLVAKESPEAQAKKIEALKKAEEENLTKIQTTWQVIKAVTPVYAPAIGTGVAAAGCIVGSDIVVNKRLTKTTASLASVTSGYLALKDHFDNYKATAEEVLGEAKKRDLDRKASERQMEKSEAKMEDAPEVSMMPTTGVKQWCYDAWSDRYFISTPEDIETAINRTNMDIMSGGEAVANDFYYNIGLAATGAGNEFGWTDASIYNTEGISPRKDTTLVNGIAVYVIDIGETLQPMWKLRKRY